MNTQLLEAPPSPVRSSQHVATHVDRVDARARAAAGAVHEQERNDRELAAQRLLQLTVPRR
jgi:hypothetical protein